MRLIILLTFFFCSSLLSTSLDTVPVAYNGRYVPYETAMQEDSLVLPSKLEPEKWPPLSYLYTSEYNFTAYSDADFYKIRDAYFLFQSSATEETKEMLGAALLNAYRSFALETTQNGLHYPSIRQLQAEQFYHRYPLFLVCFLFYAAACFTRRFGYLLLLIGFLIHTTDLGLRIYILERPPVSNMAETILYVPWIAVGIALIFRKERLLQLASAIAASALLGLFYLLGMHTTLESVQPVLNSQLWLTVHVLMVVGSYGAFILAGVLAHIYLITKNEGLTPFTLKSLYSGTFLLIVGTLLGGVWAAQSWGRFWDWDPKESWAFISSCTYLVIIHLHRFKLIGPLGLHNGAIIGMMSITFTWYGVNYILGTGFHSYGFGSGGDIFYYLYLLSEIIFLGWYNQFPRKWEFCTIPFSGKWKCDKYPKTTRENIRLTRNESRQER